MEPSKRTLPQGRDGQKGSRNTRQPLRPPVLARDLTLDSRDPTRETAPSTRLHDPRIFHEDIDDRLTRTPFRYTHSERRSEASERARLLPEDLGSSVPLSQPSQDVETTSVIVHPPNLPHDQEIRMELPLQEDIAAELDDFLQLSLLGIHDEAQDVVQTILWRHLRHFPVFAEVADYTIDKGDKVLKEQLLQSILREGIRFVPRNERAFLESVIDILDPNKSSSWRQSGLRTLVSNFNGWTSPILCQILEIQITFITNREAILSEGDYGAILDVFSGFLERGMLEDATRCFLILAASIDKFSWAADTMAVHFRTKDLFSELQTHLKYNKGSRQGTDVEQVQSDIFAANVAYLRFLNTHRGGNSWHKTAHTTIDEILQATRQLLTAAFDILPDPTPRDQHFELCEELQAVLHKDDTEKKFRLTMTAQEPAVRESKQAVNLRPDNNMYDYDDKNDPLHGLSSVAETFLNYNYVEHNDPPRFLHSSVSYLEEKPQLIYDVDVDEWRERARSAIHMNNTELARKMIQQAQIIELSQLFDVHELRKRLRWNSDETFKQFIKRTYATFLDYLEDDPEDSISHTLPLEKMLEPWATFVHYTCGEDILATLSKSRDSVSATWITTFPTITDISGLPYPESRRSTDSTYAMSRGFVPTRTRPSGISREIGAAGRSHQSPKDSSPTTRAAAWPYRNIVEPYGVKEGDVKERGQSYMEGTSKVDDDGDGDDDWDNSDEPSDNNGDSSPRFGYEHVRGRAAPDSRPRQIRDPTRPAAKSELHASQLSRTPIATQSAPFARRLPPVSTGSTSSQSNSSQSFNPVQQLAGILGGFITQRTFQECWEYFEENPELEREDLTPLHAIASNYLRQARREYAWRVVERWLMLRDAISAPEGSLEYLKRLSQVPSRQTRLKQSCEIVIKELERRIQQASSEEASSSSIATRQREPGQTANNRKDSNIDQTWQGLAF